MGDVNGLGDVQLHYVDSIDEAMNCKRWFGERHGDSQRLFVDTETSGLNPHDGDVVRLIQIGDAMAGWAIPWERWGGVAEELLRAWTGRVGFHNAPFDQQFISKKSNPRPLVEWRQVDDTRTLAWLCDPGRPTALKTISARYIDPQAAAMQHQLDDAMSGAGWTWATVPVDFELYWVYGALDTVLTARIWDHLAPRMDADPDMRRAYELEIACLPILARMAERGAPIDREYAQQTAVDFRQRVAGLQEWAGSNHGVSLTAQQQVIRRLHEYGVTWTKTTKSGAPSLDKEVLQELAIEWAHAPVITDLCRATLQARQLTKLASTYLDHFTGDAVHTHLNPLGAPKTGRMSSSDPSLHTLPRASEGNPAAIQVRNCFIPSPGNKLVTADFDQVEYRLIAHFSQDPQLMDILRGDDDPFTEMARRIYSDPTLAKKDHRRQMTKNAAYAKGYGAGAAKFSLTAGVPVNVGTEFYQAFDQTFAGVKAFQQAVQHVGEQRLVTDGAAWVRTPFGHRLVCESDKVYTLVNRLVQGTAANVMKLKLIELDNAGLGEYLVCPVHDEVIMDVPTEIAMDVGREAASVMSEYNLFSVKLPVGVDGPLDRWGEKYQ